MKKFQLALTSLSIALLMAGCGGGGGGSSGGGGGTTYPTAAVQITSTNAQTVAAGATGTSKSMASNGGSMAGAVGVVSSGKNGPSVLKIALGEFNKAKNLLNKPLVAGLQLAGGACATSGTFSIDLNDTNGNSAPDAGESMSITNTNCVEAGVTTNGSVTIAISGYDTTTTPGTIAATIALTFTNYSYDTGTFSESINGDMAISLTSDATTLTATMSGTSLEMINSVDGSFMMSSYNISFSEDTSTNYSFSVNMTTSGIDAAGADIGVMTIATTTAFTGTGTGNPTAGAMTVTGTGSITVTANSDGLTYTVTGTDYQGNAFGPNTYNW